MELYTTEEAEEDIEEGRISGLDASIKKWDTITDALVEIEQVLGETCGLCTIHERDCCFCPLFDKEYRGERGQAGICCVEFDNAYEDAKRLTRSAITMLHLLQDMKLKEVSNGEHQGDS